MTLELLMSDGPHRSLPMRRHWKDLAERAAKAAFSSDQVTEGLPYALKKDILGAPIAEIRDIMGGGSLFPDMTVESLELLRQSHYGSAATHQLIDCAIEAVTAGMSGDSGTEAALKNALEGGVRDHIRGIEEHYQREASSRSTGFVRVRLDAARQQLDCGGLARELLSLNKLPSQRSITLPRQSGIDEGPPL
jgi:hypothetical protein